MLTSVGFLLCDRFMKYELNQVYNEDCVAAMKTMPDNYFDLAIVDPPYGIGQTWSKSRQDRFFHKGDMHEYKNDAAPDRDYFEELQRVSKNQIIWGGNYFTDHLNSTNAWIVWNKLHSENTFMSAAELAWTSYSKCMKMVNLQWDGARKCEDITKVHPHQKPKKLYEWILRKYAESSMKILDTHGGSCKSIEAMIDFGCDWMAFEVDPVYFSAAVDRINTHIVQPKADFDQTGKTYSQLKID